MIKNLTSPKHFITFDCTYKVELILTHKIQTHTNKIHQRQANIIHKAIFKISLVRVVVVGGGWGAGTSHKLLLLNHLSFMKQMSRCNDNFCFFLKTRIRRYGIITCFCRS
jgi:hypothetical protein